MSDGVIIPASGTGDATPKVATDDAGAAGHVQILKLAQSADGSATPIGADANGLDVDVVRVADGANVALGATADADSASTVIGRLKKLVSLLPAALVGGRLDVNLGAAPATVTVSNAGLTELAAAIDTEVQVDVVAALPAGTNNIGDVDVLTLPAIPAGTNNIGDVDVASIAAGDNNIGNVDVVTLPAIPAGNNNIGDVDVASVVPGTGATNLGKAEDAPHTTGDVGVMALGVNNDGGSNTLTSDLGDYSPIATDYNGRVLVATGDNELVITSDGSLDVTLSASEKPEDFPHGSGDTGIMALAVRNDALAARTDTTGDYSPVSTDSLGRVLTNTVPIGTEVTKTAQYTSQQTGVALWTPTAGNRIVVQYIQIQVGGTTGGEVQVWFGASADTTYTRGTDRAIFDGEFAPSATLKPGFTSTNETGWRASTDDHILRVTTSAAINPITISVWGYEVA